MYRHSNVNSEFFESTAEGINALSLPIRLSHHINAIANPTETIRST